MADLSFPVFDADNHYYEAPDAFTRHMDPKMAKRAMQWAEVNGKQRLLVGGRINRFIPNPTFDPIARPGSLDEYFRGKRSASDIREAFGELDPLSSRPEYLDRDARIALMDQQNMAACFMFPTLGVGMETALSDDLPAMRAAFTAFNRWVGDDWGLAYQDRIFSCAYITLSDVDHAIAELEWALANDCRVINLRASAVPTDDGNVALGHPRHDPFWARVNEAGITVAFHSGDAGYSFMFEHWGLSTEFEAFRYDPLKSMLCFSPIADTVASMIGGGVFDRFPNIRMVTIETGSEWVKPLLKRMTKAYNQHTYAFAANPIETFRRNIWVAPFYEDDMAELADMIGTDHMVFGSDYPHAEGLADPTDFVHDLEGFDDAAIKTVMHDAGLALTVPRPASKA
ncbi:MAG: amidohydrolase family protein [Acidimicrobiales bacterium]|nr:amidohydrolase family protein [Acidimicrobiales bacterium]